MPELFLGFVFSVLVSGMFVGLQLFIEGQRADQAEVLANVQYIRETVRDSPGGVKSFRHMNLREADLSGLDLGCDITTNGDPSLERIGAREVEGDQHVTWRAEKRDTCADFSGADLTGARFEDTDLTGADFSDATLDEATMESSSAIAADFTRTSLDGAVITGVTLLAADFNVAKGDFAVNSSRLDGALLGLDEGRAALSLASVTQLSAIEGDGAEIQCTGGYWSYQYATHPRFRPLKHSPSTAQPVLCAAEGPDHDRACMALRYGLDIERERQLDCTTYSSLPGEGFSRVSYEWNHFTKRDLADYWESLLTADPPIPTVRP